jgi:hypothetical protein
MQKLTCQYARTSGYSVSRYRASQRAKEKHEGRGSVVPKRKGLERHLTMKSPGIAI